MEAALALRHYSSALVQEEIAAYCRSRWAAIEAPRRGQRRLFIRYTRDGRPLRIGSPSDVASLLRQLGPGVFRSVYGTVCLYAKLERAEDADDPANIIGATPTWDIDCEGDWRAALEAARVIVDFLEKHGVSRSVYLKWSGKGVHVHIHEAAIPKDALGDKTPLDAAYAIVEYVLRRVKDRLESAIRGDAKVKVENLIDPKRVFTAPLSLHRELDLCCVCFRPDAIDDFELEWARPDSFKHDPGWKIAEEGEAEHLVKLALREVGGYPSAGPIRSAVAPTMEERQPAEPPGKLGRFQVMALLQAARYFVLTGDLERAKSFGLNRAIFYAWAKHYGKDYVPKGGRARAQRTRTRLVEVLGERVPVSDGGWFAMGGVEQRPEDYDRYVASRISSVVPYEEAWRAALEYVKRFPKSVLKDPQRFFKEVYEPVRDRFLEHVLKKPKPSRSLLDFM